MYKNHHHEPNETPQPSQYVPKSTISELSIDYMGIAIAYDLPLDTPLDRPLSSAQIASLPRTRSCAATSTGAISPTFCTWKPGTAIWRSISCTFPSCARTKEPGKRKEPSSPPSSRACSALAAKLAATHSPAPSICTMPWASLLHAIVRPPRRSHAIALRSPIRRDADEQDFLYQPDECLYRLSGA